MLPGTYKLKDAAKALGYSETQLRRLVDEGELQAVEVRRKGAKYRSLRFTEPMLARFLEEHATHLRPAEPEAPAAARGKSWAARYLARREERRKG